jgi:hypothetical protein
MFGTGLLKNKIQLSSFPSDRASSIFPYGSTITLPASSRPNLEAISSDSFDPEYIKIRNTELQPEAKVKSPTPILALIAERVLANIFHRNNLSSKALWN